MTTTSQHVVLVVDLDGTLLRIDTLHEQLLGLVAADPLALRHLPGWLRQGRAGLKARIADHGAVLDARDLPLNEDVVAYVEAARAQGRRTALVSAADQRQVDAVARATGLFDEAHGSTQARNLKGKTKARFLTDRFGEKGFDYLGDSHADLKVWSVARGGATVGAGAGLRSAATSANPRLDHLSPPEQRSRAMLRALRPHQWSKNLLLFMPILAAHDITALPQTIAGFFAFCLAASSVYVINDLIDLPADRAHPRKRSRPFASGALDAVTGAKMALALLLSALILGLATGNTTFLGVLVLYLVATFAYSLWLKRKLLIDVLTLAGLYTTRILAGGAAAGVVLSPWMLGFSMFLFLALAAVKRQAELTDQMKTGRPASGRAYEVDDLPILRGIALAASHAAVLVLALYISSQDVQVLYSRPEVLWLVLPMLLYWCLRMVMKTHRGSMTDDPIVFATSDRVSLVIILMMATTTLTAAL